MASSPQKECVGIENMLQTHPISAYIDELGLVAYTYN